MKIPKHSLSSVQDVLYAAMTKVELCDEKMNKRDKEEVKSFIPKLQGMCSALDRIILLKNSPF